MTKSYSSPAIARELKKQFGDRVRNVKVDMQGTREVGAFIHKVQKAERSSQKSKLVFK